MAQIFSLIWSLRDGVYLHVRLARFVYGFAEQETKRVATRRAS